MSRPRSWASSGLAIATAVAGVVFMTLGGTAAFGAAAGTALDPCVALGHGDHVHFLVDQSARPSPAMSGAVISGLDQTSCDGKSVIVTFFGNTAGNPNQQMSQDKRLAVFDSARNPCTGQVLTDPLHVAAGTITLHGCALVTDPTRAAYVDIHDVTLMRVQVNGQDIGTGPPATVLGETFTNGQSGSRSSGHGADLPFTGTSAALTFWTGVALVLFGTLTYYCGVRRRRA